MVDRQPVDPNEPIMGGQNLKKESKLRNLMMKL